MAADSGRKLSPTSASGRLLLVVALLIAVIDQSVAVTTVTTDITTAVKLIGQPLRLSCVVTNLSPNFLIWQKDTPKGPVKFATNFNLESAYAPLSPNRYKMSIGKSDPPTSTFEFVLDIFAAALEDSGNYTCLVPNIPGVSAKFSVVVIANPQQPIVTVKKNEEADEIEISESGSVFSVSEGDNYEIKCSASGSFPASTVTITAGSWYHAEATHVTSTPNVVKTAYPGLDKLTYNVDKTDSNVRFDFFIKPRIVNCSAFVTVGDYVGPTSWISFDVKYVDFLPMISCQPEVNAKPHESEVHLRCNATVPYESEPTITFSYHDHNRNLTLRPDQISPDGTYLSNAEIHGEVYVLELLIKDVPEDAFGVYIFTVSNDKGEAKGSVTLKKVIPTTTTTTTTVKPGAASGQDKQPNGAFHVAAPAGTVMVLALLLVSVCHI